MKTKLTIILFAIVTIACHAPQNKPTKKRLKAVAKIDSSTNKEYMDWSKVKINGIIPMISSFKDVVKQLGKPDKIDTVAEDNNDAYYNKKFQYYYFKGLTFKRYSDTLIFSKLNFSKSPSFYLTDGTIRFDSSSKDLDFNRIFPNSFENNQLSGSDMDIYEYIFLAPSHDKTYNQWVFTFHTETGKIWAVDYDDSGTNK